MNSNKTIVAPPLCDLTEHLQNRHFHWLCIGAKRDVLMLSIDEPVQSNGSALRRKNQIYDFRLIHWHNGTVREVQLPPTQQAFYAMQVLGNDFLCVASRCNPDEPNAHVFDASGNILRSWHVGDGVEDVQVAPDGEIWVSYFDEGVFGNTLLAGEGLNCFDAQGNHKFGFFTDMTGKIEQFFDCYALNVSSNRDTWLLPDTDFSLVHLRDRKLKASYQPPPEIVGSSTIAVCDSRRLFIGGYHFENQIFWRDEATKRQIELEVTDENGDELPWNHACGRGADLFLCNGPKAWMLSLNKESPRQAAGYFKESVTFGVKAQL